MKQKLINDVLQGILSFLHNAQTAQLQKVLECGLAKVKVTECEQKPTEIKNGNERLAELFLSAKRVEDCSEKSLSLSAIINMKGSG